MRAKGYHLFSFQVPFVKLSDDKASLLCTRQLAPERISALNTDFRFLHLTPSLPDKFCYRYTVLMVRALCTFRDDRKTVATSSIMDWVP